MVANFLRRGWKVRGIDNFSKYGHIHKEHDNHPNFTLIIGDAKDRALMDQLLEPADVFVNAAAMIGGISYFHKHAYDLLAENERIMATAFDAAIHAFQSKRLQRIIQFSSSMVFENAVQFPSFEEDVRFTFPPNSTYGFQKLATEYFCRGAHEQYKLPYTIVRPFNAYGIGESSTPSTFNESISLSHVVPDLIRKIAIDRQDPLEILGDGEQIRTYTFAGDIAYAIGEMICKNILINDDINISSDETYSVKELAQIIWSIYRPDEELTFKHLQPFAHDVKKRIPSTEKMKMEMRVSFPNRLEKEIPNIYQFLEANL
jgi:UDP-glucose 4-epimerase